MERFIEKGILTADQINSVMEYMTGKPCGTVVAFEGSHGEQFTAYNDNQGENVDFTTFTPCNDGY